jgi:hypothetical protein
MDRIDSGLDAFYSTKASSTDMERLQPQRSHTAPTHSRKHRTSPSGSPTKPQATDIPNQRLTCEKRPNAARRSTTEPRRRPSVGSSSENSTTRSRPHERGSKHSSRRTSCTLVDPSRPARHYRIKNSQNVPPGDIDDVLALHFRACSLFDNPSYYSPLPSPGVSGYAAVSESGSMRASTDIGPRHGNPVSGLRDYQSADYFNITNPKIRVSQNYEQSEETTATPQSQNTTMHWMSPGTRKRQYENIDKANSGLRGFVSKIVPRCVSGPPPPKFYEKDKSDAGSVRRYRVSDEADEEDKGGLEKSTSTLRPPYQNVKRTVSSDTTASARSRAKWGCF